MAKLDIIIGPMFSGKSTELVRRIKMLQSIGKEPIVIKPMVDNRYNQDKITTHNYESVKSLSVSTLKELEIIFTDTLKKYIIIDEGQFFPDLYETIILWLTKYNVDIVIGGLDGDCNKQPIGDILKLIPYSNNTIKLNSYCKLCLDGTFAPFTKKINENGKQVEIGGSELYLPVCRNHS